MPLLDHFHPPLHGPRRWEGFLHAWATCIVQTLNRDILPDDYFAVPEISLGPQRVSAAGRCRCGSEPICVYPFGLRKATLTPVGRCGYRLEMTPRGLLMDELVSEESINYDEIYRRGGANCGDEDFAFFKCPACGYVYLLEYDGDTVYLDPTDLSRRVPVSTQPFHCARCGENLPDDEPWIGPAAKLTFDVSWEDLAASGWIWAANKPTR